MGFKILDIIPIVMGEELKHTLEDRKNLAREIKEKTNGAVEMNIVSLEKGSTSLEYAFDEIYSGPYIIQKVKWAEENGYDAAVIDCFFDPVLDVARELVSIPVFGPCQSSVFLASQISLRFSIVSPTPSGNRIVMENLEKYHVERKLASMRFLDTEVLELEKEENDVKKALVEESKKAVLEDGAEAIILGCTGMSSFAQYLQDNLKKELDLSIPVIEPLRAAVFNAISVVLMGVSHSKRTYPYPVSKKRFADWETS